MLATRARMSPPKKDGGGDTPDVLVLYERYDDDDNYLNWQEGYSSGAGEVDINDYYLLVQTNGGERTIVTKQAYDLTDYNYLTFWYRGGHDTRTSDISNVSGDQYIRFHAFQETGAGPPMEYAALVVGSGQMDSHTTYTKNLFTHNSFGLITYVALTKEYPE